MDWFFFVLAALAVHRISNLIVVDSITADLREWWWQRFPVNDFVYKAPKIVEHEGRSFVVVWPFKREVLDDIDWGWVPVNVYKLGELIECVFCVSVWVSAAVALVVVGYNELPAVFEYLLYLFGVAGAVEILNSKLSR